MSFDYRILPFRGPPRNSVLWHGRTTDLPWVAGLKTAGLAVEEVMPAAVGLYTAWRTLSDGSGAPDRGPRARGHARHRARRGSSVRAGRACDEIPGRSPTFSTTCFAVRWCRRSPVRMADLVADRLVVTGGRAAKA